MESFLTKKEEDAANTEDFINSLKVKMEHELQDKFDEFKTEIEKFFPPKKQFSLHFFQYLPITSEVQYVCHTSVFYASTLLLEH